MINDTQLDINDGVVINNAKLQTEVSEATQNYLGLAE